MANKKLVNEYRLPNVDVRITDADELDRIFEDFPYFCETYQQIIDKNGILRPMKLNAAQKYVSRKLLKLVMKDTRINRRKNIVLVKSRQIGLSTLVTVLTNYTNAFVEGINNLHTYHIFPVGASGGKFYANKILPLINGVHPDIYPTIERTFSDSTTKELTYIHTQGAPRNNRYEVVSANASSLRGGTGQILILDEVADYARPYELEAAIDPAIPEDGFALVMYLSTFSDKRSPYFLEKIKLALENPEDWEFIFIPWYVTYPEVKTGIKLEDIELTEYDKKVIIPALESDNIPRNEWGDCISWYHRKELAMPLRVKQEFPTTIDEVIALGSNEKVFSKGDIEQAKKNSKGLKGAYYNIVTDMMTQKQEARICESSPLKIFRQPVYGRKYMISVDPITSASDDSDFFCASVMDTQNNEQVATIRGRGIPEEEWAIMTVAVAKLYNRATICPESNVAEGFKATVYNLGYYNWYYANAMARKNRTPGIRTTVGSKVNMIEILQYLIRNNNIIIHDEDWIKELEIFERKVKKMGNDRSVVTYAAPNKEHDDTVATLWIYAGTLKQDQIVPRGEKKLVVAGG